MRRVVIIQNIPSARFYRLMLGAGAWTSQPMLLPPSGWKPRPQQWKGKKVKGSDPVEGLQTFTHVDKQNIKTVYAPAINSEAVCRTWPNGITMRLTDIRLEEPPLGDFVPPPGASVVVRTDPGGIVAVKRPKSPGPGPGSRRATSLPTDVTKYKAR